MSDAATQQQIETPAAPPVAPEQTGKPAKVASVGPSGRPVTTRTIVHGSVVAEPQHREGEVRTLRSSSPAAPRSFTEYQKQMLANLDKHGDVRGASSDEKPAETESKVESKPPPVGAEAAKTGSDAKTETKVTPPAEVAKPAPAPDPDTTARLERLTEHNKRLVLENERLTARAAKAEPDARMKALDEIERGFTTDPYGSIRKLVALNAGIDDPKHEDVEQAMAGLYSEWTGKELKVPMDPGQQALIEGKRNRLLIERDKREKAAEAKAAEERAAAASEAERHAIVARQLGEHLDESKHKERFPLLMKHAKTFDNVTPGQLLYSAIRRGLDAGELDRKTPDKTLIDHYSKEIETHYQALRDQLAEAPPTSTAAPTQATVSTKDDKADAPDKGVRTITNASASVAPPAPPAKPTSTAPSETGSVKRKPNENEKTFRERAAKAYFKDDPS